MRAHLSESISVFLVSFTVCWLSPYWDSFSFRPDGSLLGIWRALVSVTSC